MSKLNPNKNVQKILISSPTHFFGGYESSNLLISPISNQEEIIAANSKTERDYFVIAYVAEPMEPIYNPESKKIEDSSIISVNTYPYKYVYKTICVYLSILFGKRFDYHGFFENYGLYELPYFNNNLPIYYTNIGPYNNFPRKDLGIELNLIKVDLIKDLLFNESLDKKLLNIFFTAGKFYSRSLKIFEQEPDLAFLDLVNCGEILSNYVDYSGNIIDRYTKAISDLLNNYFFTNSETDENWSKFSLKKEDIKVRIRESYNLRSKYLHTGISFGEVHKPAKILNEITMSSGVYIEQEHFRGTKDADSFNKALKLSPTYIGMERIIRFCLLRFIHKNFIQIDNRLND